MTCLATHAPSRGTNTITSLLPVCGESNSGQCGVVATMEATGETQES